MDKMREEFEVWAISCEMCTYLDNAEYRHQSTEWAWRAWQSSRAALCVELPGAYNQYECDYKKEVIDTLDGVGVTYK